MIYIVIPVYNRWKYTQACIESLNKQTYKDFKIVVVDDGSSDGTSENILSMYPDVHVIKGDGNLWWTGGINEGAKYALSKKADYVLSLNNDTLTYPDYLEQLILAAKKKPKSLIGSLAVNPKNDENIHAAGFIKWYSDSYIDLLSVLNEKEKKGIHEVDFFPGRGLLIPVDVFGAIGLFDQKNFPHYMADYDFTLRAKKKGYKIYCCFEARLGVYLEESGAHEIFNKKTLKNYKEHLFGMKGAGNLPLYYKYVLRHSPPLQKIPSLLIGTLKRLTNFWIKDTILK